MRCTIARAWRTPPNSSSNIDQLVHWKSQNPYSSIFLNNCIFKDDNCFLTQELLTYLDTRTFSKKDTRKKVMAYSLVEICAMDLWFHNRSYSYKDGGMVTIIAITHFRIYIGEDRWRLVSSTEVDTSIRRRELAC